MRIADAARRPAGFDYMRLALATGVIVVHSFHLVASEAAAEQMWNGPARAVIGLILPMFFALSGFLVTGSLERNRSLVSFLGLRVIRLMPALTVEVTLSALILGPLFTSLALSDYVRAPQFHNYFLNIVGDIHYELPGVFTGNPYGSAVNGQLWTIPFELECYAVIAVLAFVGIASRTRLLLWALAALQVAAVAYPILMRHPPPVMFPGRVLVGCFLAGIAFYKLKDRIPMRADLLLAALASTELCLFIPYGFNLLCAPVAYIVCFLGTLNPRRLWVVSSGDYSYGLYLYGFPIQQACIAAGAWSHHALVNLALAYPAAFAVAYVSWHGVEKPALLLKAKISRCEAWILRAPPLDWHSRRVFSPGG